LILVADVLGYSRLAGSVEKRTLARLRGARRDRTPPIAAHCLTGGGSAARARGFLTGAGEQ